MVNPAPLVTTAHRCYSRLSDQREKARGRESERDISMQRAENRESEGVLRWKEEGLVAGPALIRPILEPAGFIINLPRRRASERWSLSFIPAAESYRSFCSGSLQKFVVTCCDEVFIDPPFPRAKFFFFFFTVSITGFTTQQIQHFIHTPLMPRCRLYTFYTLT